MKMPFPFSSVAIGIVLLVMGSLSLLTIAILALLSPSYSQTQRNQLLVYACIHVLVVVSGISLILSGRASKKEKQE